jgi:hypothetical protein
MHWSPFRKSAGGKIELLEKALAGKNFSNVLVLRIVSLEEKYGESPYNNSHFPHRFCDFRRNRNCV